MLEKLIDFHVITLPTDNPEWFAQCVESIKHPRVNVFLVRGTFEHIGEGRKRGLEQGVAPYVSWVDADDWLEVGAVDRMIECLGESGLCAAEYVRDYHEVPLIRGDQTGATEISSKNFPACHHPIILKRDLITPFLDELLNYPNTPEYWLMAQVTKIVTIPYLHEPLYNWRIHANQWHLQGRFDEFEI